MSGQPLRIVTATGVGMDDLRHGMIAGFSGYAVPMRPDARAFALMMRQRGMTRDASWVALAEGRVVAVWLVSVAGDRGYLIASGTDPAYRGRGIARQLANASMAGLKARGLRSFQTEVMNGNDAAFGLYRSLGMKVRRALNCYGLPSPVATSLDAKVRSLAWPEIAAGAAGCRDWAPSWQNDDAALSRITDALACRAVTDDRGLAGYAVLVRPSGVLSQIAVRPDLRRTGLGRALIAALPPADPLRVLNVDASDAGFDGFMTALGAQRTPGQRELILDL